MPDDPDYDEPRPRRKPRSADDDADDVNGEFDDRPRRQRRPRQEDDAMSTLIPYKNGKALTSYYLGVFGLIPFLGLPLALAAVVLGFMGLKYAKQQPLAKGEAHAITGIVLGTLSILGCGVLPVVGIAIGALSK
jgi:hypothetical protein